MYVVLITIPVVLRSEKTGTCRKNRLWPQGHRLKVSSTLVLFQYFDGEVQRLHLTRVKGFRRGVDKIFALFSPRNCLFCENYGKQKAPVPSKQLVTETSFWGDTPVRLRRLTRLTTKPHNKIKLKRSPRQPQFECDRMAISTPHGSSVLFKGKVFSFYYLHEYEAVSFIQ